MATLYIIGGSPRAGKSTVAQRFLQARPMPILATDAMRFAVRSALFDEPYVSVDELHFSGNVVFRRPGEQKTHHKNFQRDLHENDLGWRAVAGFIDHYDRTDKDVLVEGMLATPEVVHNLRLQNLSVRAAFLGYSIPAYADTILLHAKSNPKDWINQDLEAAAGDEAETRQWIAKEIAGSQESARKAAEYGYTYFDVSTAPSFEDHVKRALDYLLHEDTPPEKA